MYPNDRKNPDNFQGLVPVDFLGLPDENEADTKQSALDPFAQQVLSVSLDLLTDQERITIKDVLDVFEEMKIQTSDSVIRDRMSDLVDAGQLHCLPGAGRRPSYYSVPKGGHRGVEVVQEPPEDVLDGNTSKDGDAMLAHLAAMAKSTAEKAEEINKDIEAKKAQLESLHKDIEAYQRVIANLQGHSQKKSQEESES